MPQKTSVSTELALGDDSTQTFTSPDSDAPGAGSDPVGAAVAAAAGSLPPISLEQWEEPPEWMKQVNRGAGILFNSGVVALLRAYMNPPQAVVPEPGTPGVPEWFTEEYEQRTRGRRLAGRVARDTAVFMAGCYIMDWVDSAMEKIRGVKDPMNKVMGGIAAGGLIGFSWYPLDPRARALVTLCGGAVGFVTHVTDTASTAYLLAQQRALEKKLLHKPDAELKTEMNPYYLRALIRTQQMRELEIARRAAAQIDALDSITSNPNPNAPARPASFAASGLTGAATASRSASSAVAASGNDRGVLVISEDADAPADQGQGQGEAASAPASSGSGGAQQRRR